jgi:hypothetical protein
LIQATSNDSLAQFGEQGRAVEFEFNYVSTITGFLASKSKEQKTRFIRETARVELPEYNDDEAPIAYSKTGWWRTQTTRWLNGSHWKVTEVPEGHDFDPLHLVMDYHDYSEFYRPTEREGVPSVENKSAFFGFVERDKRWHQVTGDTAEQDREDFLAYARENAAVIGGKFAYRVLEPRVEFGVEWRDRNSSPQLVSWTRFTTKPEAMTYHASLLESEDAARELVELSSLDKPILIKPINRPEFILEEAFSPTLVEEASVQVMQDTFRMLRNQSYHMTARSQELVGNLKAECLDAKGRLTMDAITAGGLILDRCAAIRASEPDRKGRLTPFETYLDHDIPVTMKRLELKRAMTPSICSLAPRL